MELLLEILIECFTELITDGGMEVLSGEEHTRRWPKGVKIAMVVFTLLFFGSMIIGLIVMGVAFMLEGKVILSVVMLLAGIGLLVLLLYVIRKAKRTKKQGEGGNNNAL